MIHQPSAGTQGKVTDMEIDVEHFLKIKQRLNKILSENTGKPVEQVKAGLRARPLDGPPRRPGNTAW